MGCCPYGSATACATASPTRQRIDGVEDLRAACKPGGPKSCRRNNLANMAVCKPHFVAARRYGSGIRNDAGGRYWYVIAALEVTSANNRVSDGQSG